MRIPIGHDVSGPRGKGSLVKHMQGEGVFLGLLMLSCRVKCHLNRTLPWPHFLPGEFPFRAHSLFPGAALLQKEFQDFHASPSFTVVGHLLISCHSVYLFGIFSKLFRDGSSRWSFTFAYCCHPNYIYICLVGSLGEALQTILKDWMHLKLNKVYVWQSMPLWKRTPTKSSSIKRNIWTNNVVNTAYYLPSWLATTHISKLKLWEILWKSTHFTVFNPEFLNHFWLLFGVAPICMLCNSFGRHTLWERLAKVLQKWKELTFEME